MDALDTSDRKKSEEQQSQNTKNCLSFDLEAFEEPETEDSYLYSEGRAQLTSLLTEQKSSPQASSCMVSLQENNKTTSF